MPTYMWFLRAYDRKEFDITIVAWHCYQTLCSIIDSFILYRINFEMWVFTTQVSVYPELPWSVVNQQESPLY